MQLHSTVKKIKREFVVENFKKWHVNKKSSNTSPKISISYKKFKPNNSKAYKILEINLIE